MAYIPNQASVVVDAPGGLNKQVTTDPDTQTELIKIRLLLQALVEKQGADLSEVIVD